MSGQWRAFLEAQGWSGSRRLFLVVMRRDQPMGKSQRYAVAPPTLIPLKELEKYDVPTLEESHEDRQDNIGDVQGFLQAIVDVAWENGIRPAGLADQSNELSAVRYHLEDMRKIAKVPGAV